MLKFIVRLDDACPSMDDKKWLRVEQLLNKYQIKPIVGIIPDNKDKEFCYSSLKNFWTEIVPRWQEHDWIIAQHGLHHDLSKTVRTEFSGKSFQEQKEILTRGYELLQQHHVKPVCFFAPAHTFDNETIAAIKELQFYKFVSDGYAFYPYKKNGVLFLPSVFDTPHKLFPFGIYTFIYHPNNMKEEDFQYLETFIQKYRKQFDVHLDFLLDKYGNRHRNIFDYLLQLAIVVFRKVRGKYE